MTALARALVGIIVIALVVAPAAGSSETAETLIRPGIGIGKLELGMSLKEARKALGQPLVVYDAPRGVAGGSLRLIQYESDNALWRIELLGARGKETLVSINTSSRRERLSNGVGVGTLVANLPERLQSLKVRCIGGSTVINSRPTDVAPLTCAITTGRATTVFFGDVVCVGETIRYQGCQQTRVPVVSVTVEGPELSRYRLSDWNP